MVRTTDFRARRNQVLAAVIDYYVKTAVPVSSEAIATEYDFNLSPATIRNVFADLERAGFLTHPHTSAGRIPTQKGYRYYVDYLMKEIQLIGEEKARIEAEYRKNIKRLEVLLDRTSQVLSDITHCAGIVSLQDDRLFYRGASFIVEQPEFKNIEKIRRILRLLEEKERLLEIINRDLEKRIEIYIGNELACRDIDSCSLVVSHYHAKKGQAGSIAVLGPTRMPYSRIVSAVEYMSELVEQILEDF
jgi:transcriptional regulator of heat shock response